MKKIVRFCFGLFVFMAGIYVFLYFYINERGPTLLRSYLQSNYSLSVTIQKVTLKFPFKIAITNLSTEDTRLGVRRVSCPQIVFDLAGFNPFSGEVMGKLLYFHGLKIEFDADIFSNYSQSIPEISREDISPVIALRRKHFKGNAQSIVSGIQSFYFKNVFIKDTQVTFVNSEVKPELSLSLEHINVNIYDLRFPSLSRCSIKMTSDFRLNEYYTSDAVFLEGWIDWNQKSMDIRCDTSALDYFMLKEYYPPFWKPDNLYLKEAKVSIKTRFISERDDLLVKYTLILNKVKFLENSADQSRVKAIKTALDFFRRDGVPLVQLSHRTKMSHPHLEISNIGERLFDQLKGADLFSFKDALERIMGKTQANVEDGVKGIRRLTIDPAIGAVRNLADDFIKNLRKIIEEDTYVDNNIH